MPDVVFVCDSEVGAREFPVPQLQAGRQKPTASEADVEDGRVLVLRQQVPQFVYRLQHLGLLLHLGPRDRRLGSSVPQSHSPIYFLRKRVRFHRGDSILLEMLGAGLPTHFRVHGWFIPITCVSGEETPKAKSFMSARPRTCGPASLPTTLDPPRHRRHRLDGRKTNRGSPKARRE